MTRAKRRQPFCDFRGLSNGLKRSHAPMRRFSPVLATFVLAALFFGLQSQPGHAQARTAESVMAAARAALGGEAKIAAVKTFIATGRTRQVRGENLVPIEFEIQAELPDKYARRDE